MGNELQQIACSPGMKPKKNEENSTMLLYRLHYHVGYSEPSPTGQAEPAIGNIKNRKVGWDLGQLWCTSPGH